MDDGGRLLVRLSQYAICLCLREYGVARTTFALAAHRNYAFTIIEAGWA
jgi:hypothetical protein